MSAEWIVGQAYTQGEGHVNTEGKGWVMPVHAKECPRWLENHQKPGERAWNGISLTVSEGTNPVDT